MFGNSVEVTLLKETLDKANRLTQAQAGEISEMTQLNAKLMEEVRELSWKLKIQQKEAALACEERVNELRKEMQRTLIESDLKRTEVLARLEVYEKTGQRWLRFGPSEQFITKCQFKGIDNGEPANLPAILEKVLSYEYGQKEEGKKGVPASNAKQAQGS
ncbi:hypothetical protein EOM86_10985 [Candidatus Nomurabacteria bacterium]|nr:hypothetical protein [Candidatus Nomurabacteria bacterium]